MHNAAIMELGLNWRYLAFDVRPEELRAAIAGAGSMGFIGLNLTVPHKLLAMDIVDVVDEQARVWGAVNTVRFEALHAGGAWIPLGQQEPPEGAPVRAHGFNTDADAIIRAVQEDLGVKLKGSRVLVLGAGGAGRTAALRLACEEVGELYLVNRTMEKAEAVALEAGRLAPGARVRLGYPAKGEAVDLVLNATSLGLKPGDGMPFDTAAFRLASAGAVYDMIYRPAETPFLRAAAEAGCRVANGLGMLLYQGARALELWCGGPVPVGTMRAALEENVYGRRPVGAA